MNRSACGEDRGRGGSAAAGARRRGGYSGRSGGKPFPGGAAVPSAPLRGGSFPPRRGLCGQGGTKCFGTSAFTGRELLVASSFGSAPAPDAGPLPCRCQAPAYLKRPLASQAQRPRLQKACELPELGATQDLVLDRRGRTVSCRLFPPRSWGRQCPGWERGGGGCRLTSPSCSPMALLLRLGCSLLALSTCLLPRARADCGRDCTACAYRLGPRAGIHPLVSGSGAGGGRPAASVPRRPLGRAGPPPRLNFGRGEMRQRSAITKINSGEADEVAWKTRF